MKARQRQTWGLTGLALVSWMTGCASRLAPPGDRAWETSAAWVGGRPAVVWHGGHLAHEAIFLRSADSRGRPAGPLLQLSDASRDAFEPSLQDLEGDALVAWYEQDSAPPGSPRRQRAIIARFDLAGRRLWQRQLSAEDATGRVPVARVAGHVIHVAWLEQRGEAAPVVRVGKLDAAGQWLQAPRDAALVGGNTWNLNAAVGPDGGFHVLFDTEQGSRASEIHWVHVRDERIDDQRVTRDDGQPSVYPDIAFDGSRFAITWFDSRDGNDEVYLRCGELGSTAGPPALRDEFALRVTHSPGQSSGAYLAWYEGRIELAWTEVAGQQRVLWRQAFDPDCRPLGRARAVSGQGAAAGIASLSASPQGLMLAWDARHGDPGAPAASVLLKIWPRRPVSPSAAAR